MLWLVGLAVSAAGAALFVAATFRAAAWVLGAAALSGATQGVGGVLALTGGVLLAAFYAVATKGPP